MMNPIPELQIPNPMIIWLDLGSGPLPSSIHDYWVSSDISCAKSSGNFIFCIFSVCLVSWRSFEWLCVFIGNWLLPADSKIEKKKGERELERERQTDRQTDRQTGRERERERERERDFFSSNSINAWKVPSSARLWCVSVLAATYVFRVLCPAHGCSSWWLAVRWAVCRVQES